MWDSSRLWAFYPYSECYKEAKPLSVNFLGTEEQELTWRSEASSWHCSCLRQVTVGPTGLAELPFGARVLGSSQGEEAGVELFQVWNKSSTDKRSPQQKPLSGMACWKAFWQVQQLGVGKAPSLIVSSFLLLRVGEGSAPLGLQSRAAKLWRWLFGYRGSKIRVTSSPPLRGLFWEFSALTTGKSN